MGTRTRVTGWVATAALLAATATGLAQNPFEGFPPTAPPTPEPPTHTAPGAPSGSAPLPPPTTPTLPTLPTPAAPLPRLTAPIPTLEPLDPDASSITLTPLDPTAPDRLAWIAARAHALPLTPYTPPADTGVELLAITIGRIPSAALRHEHRILVLTAGETLPNGVRVERIDPHSVTLTNDAGPSTVRLTPRRTTP